MGFVCVDVCMDWIDRVYDDEMMWGVDNGDALDALEQLAECEPYEKAIVAEGDGHHVVFYVGLYEGEPMLMEVSMKEDWSGYNSEPSRSMAGRVDNIYQFRSDWQDVSVTNQVPEVVK